MRDVRYIVYTSVFASLHVSYVVLKLPWNYPCNLQGLKQAISISLKCYNHVFLNYNNTYTHPSITEDHLDGIWSWTASLIITTTSKTKSIDRTEISSVTHLSSLFEKHLIKNFPAVHLTVWMFPFSSSLKWLSAVPPSLSHRSEGPSETNKQANVMPGNITDTSCGIDLRLGWWGFSISPPLQHMPYRPCTQTSHKHRPVTPNTTASAVFSSLPRA